jgi:hypothetical protein
VPHLCPTRVEVDDCRGSKDGVAAVSLEGVGDIKVLLVVVAESKVVLVAGLIDCGAILAGETAVGAGGTGAVQLYQNAD